MRASPFSTAQHGLGVSPERTIPVASGIGNLSIRISRQNGRIETTMLEMKSYNIAVIGGDGTGPEVIREAIKVLDAAAGKFHDQTRLHPLRSRRRALSANPRSAAR